MQHHLIIWQHDGGLCDNGHYHKPGPSLGLISDNGQRGKTILQKKKPPPIKDVLSELTHRRGTTAIAWNIMYL